MYPEYRYLSIYDAPRDKIIYLHISVEEFDNEVLDFCKTYLLPIKGLQVFLLDIGKFKTEDGYDQLLEFVFDSSYSAVKDLTIKFNIVDQSNKLLRYIENSLTITALRFTIDNGEGYRLVSTTSEYLIKNIRELDIVNQNKLVFDAILFEKLYMSQLNTLNFYGVSLNGDTQNFIGKHSATLQVLDIRSSTFTLGWDFVEVLQSCKRLSDLTLDHSNLPLRLLAHPNLNVIRLDSFANKITYENVNDTLCRMVNDLDCFIQNKVSLFPRLHTIQLLDFHHSEFHKSNVLLQTYINWATFLSDCSAKNVLIQDVLMDNLSETTFTSYIM